MTIYERINNALSALALPMAANQYLAASGQDLPDLYIVYHLISNVPEQHADNAETIQSYRVQLSIYSRAGFISLPNIKGSMISSGFMHDGSADLEFNPSTGHYGLAMDFIYLE